MLVMNSHSFTQGNHQVKGSTEWEMDQGFDCWCAADICQKHINGAKDMPTEQLKKYVLADHIKELLAERD